MKGFYKEVTSAVLENRREPPPLTTVTTLLEPVKLPPWAFLKRKQGVEQEARELPQNRKPYFADEAPDESKEEEDERNEETKEQAPEVEDMEEDDDHGRSIRDEEENGEEEEVDEEVETEEMPTEMEEEQQENEPIPSPPVENPPERLPSPPEFYEDSDPWLHPFFRDFDARLRARDELIQESAKRIKNIMTAIEPYKAEVLPKFPKGVLEPEDTYGKIPEDPVWIHSDSEAED